MCGVRLGNIVSRNKDVMSAAMKLAMARLSPPFLAQVAAEAAIDTPQSYFDAVHKEYTERRNTLVEGLNAIPGVHTPVPAESILYNGTPSCRRLQSLCGVAAQRVHVRGATVADCAGQWFLRDRGQGIAGGSNGIFVIKREDLVSRVVVCARPFESLPGRVDL